MPHEVTHQPESTSSSCLGMYLRPRDSRTRHSRRRYGCGTQDTNRCSKGLEAESPSLAGSSAAKPPRALRGCALADGDHQRGQLWKPKSDQICRYFLPTRGVGRRPSSFRLVVSMASTSSRSVGRVVRYSAASTLFGRPSSAYLATAWSFSAHRISPTGGFSSGNVQCSRA